MKAYFKHSLIIAGLIAFNFFNHKAIPYVQELANRHNRDGHFLIYVGLILISIFFIALLIIEKKKKRLEIVYLGIFAISLIYWLVTFDDIECMQCSRA